MLNYPYSLSVVALNIELVEISLTGIEGGSVSVCANITGDVMLEVPVMASLMVLNADAQGEDD